MIMLSDVQELSQKISHCKEKLHQAVKESGLNSSETLSYSQQLDQHILTYQKYSQQKEWQHQTEIQNAFCILEEVMVTFASFLFKPTIDILEFYRNEE